jgi:hypothetical protein
MKKYGIMVTNGSYRLYESDSGEVFKVEDVLIRDNNHDDFVTELLKEKDDKIAELEKVIAAAQKIAMEFAV